MKLGRADFFPLVFLTGMTMAWFSVPIAVLDVGDMFDGMGVGIGDWGRKSAQGMTELGGSLITIGFLGAFFLADYRHFVRALVASLLIPPVFSILFLLFGGFSFLVIQNVFSACVPGGKDLTCHYRERFLQVESNRDYLGPCLRGYIWNCQQLKISTEFAGGDRNS